MWSQTPPRGYLPNNEKKKKKKTLVSYLVTVGHLTYKQSVAYIVPQSEQLVPIVDDEVAVGLM